MSDERIHTHFKNIVTMVKITPQKKLTCFLTLKTYRFQLRILILFIYVEVHNETFIRL